MWQVFKTGGKSGERGETMNKKPSAQLKLQNTHGFRTKQYIVLSGCML